MSAVIQQYDITEGLELTTGEEVSLEATRWLFYAGDVIDPTRKEDIPRLAIGGEELANVCLHRTGGFIPKCEITPLEMWTEWMDRQDLPSEPGVARMPLLLKGELATPLNPNGILPIGKQLYGYPFYPGEMITDVLGISRGAQRGVVEVEAVRAVPYETGEVQAVQALYWLPNQPKPVQLRLVEERIHQVAEQHQGARDVAEDMLKSCTQFRRYAQNQVNKCHTQLAERVKHEHVYTYSDKVRMFLEQLEIAPKGESVMADSLNRVINNNPELFEQLEARDEKMIERLSTAMATALATALKPTKQSKAE